MTCATASRSAGRCAGRAGGAARRRRAASARVRDAARREAACGRAAPRRRPGARRPRPRGGEVAARRDEPVAGEHAAAASSTASAFTTPFRSSTRPGGRRRICPVEAQLPQPRRRGGPEQAVRGQQREVAVVAGGLERGAERRVDETARQPRPRRARRGAPARRAATRRSAGLGDAFTRDSSLSATKPAERRLPAGEDFSHRRRVSRPRRRSRTPSSGSGAPRSRRARHHRGRLDGRRDLPAWRALRRTAASNDAGTPSGRALCFMCPGACERAPTNATPKTSVVRAPNTSFAPRARERACSIRDPPATAAVSAAPDETDDGRPVNPPLPGYDGPVAVSASTQTLDAHTLRRGLPDLRAEDPRQAARVPRLGGELAEAAPDARGDETISTRPRTRTCTAASTSWPSARPRGWSTRARRCGAFVNAPDAARDDLRPQRDRGDQPRRVRVGAHEPRPRRPRRSSPSSSTTRTSSPGSSSRGKTGARFG